MFSYRKKTQISRANRSNICSTDVINLFGVILTKLWGKDDFFTGRSMDVFITKLRKKLAMDDAVQIMNIRGRGYKIIQKD